MKLIYIEELRKYINTNDILTADNWLRERGRSSVHAWLGLPIEVRADILAVTFALAKERERKMGNLKVVRLQKERLEKHWSLLTCSQKLIKAGLPNAKPDAIFSQEINPRKRHETDKYFVRACEDVFDLDWETLSEYVQPERVPIPKKSYEKPEE